MAQQGKQMRVGSCKDFAYHSVKLVSLANAHRYEANSITYFSKCVVKSFFYSKYFPVSTLTFFDAQSNLYNLWLCGSRQYDSWFFAVSLFPCWRWTASLTTTSTGKRRRCGPRARCARASTPTTTPTGVWGQSTNQRHAQSSLLPSHHRAHHVLWSHHRSVTIFAWDVNESDTRIKGLRLN